MPRVIKAKIKLKNTKKRKYLFIEMPTNMFDIIEEYMDECGIDMIDFGYTMGKLFHNKEAEDMVKFMTMCFATGIYYAKIRNKEGLCQYLSKKEFEGKISESMVELKPNGKMSVPYIG